jgi:hypothetical protein
LIEPGIEAHHSAERLGNVGVVESIDAMIAAALV